MPKELVNPNELFNDKTLAPPWEPFWDCISFATDDCPKDCDNCDAPKDEIDLLCEAKW